MTRYPRIFSIVMSETRNRVTHSYSSSDHRQFLTDLTFPADRMPPYNAKMNETPLPRDALPWRKLFGSTGLAIGICLFFWLGEKPSYWPSIVLVFWIIGWKLGFNVAHYRKRRRIWLAEDQNRANTRESSATLDVAEFDSTRGSEWAALATVSWYLAFICSSAAVTMGTW